MVVELTATGVTTRQKEGCTVKLSVRRMAVAGLLAAISFVMGYVFPVLGFIPVPTAAGRATIMHIPAIIGGIAEGPLVGTFIGLMFGLLSFLTATSPAFADPLISILPRLFIGIVGAYTFYGLRRFGLVAGLAGAAIAGTLTNTILVLSMMVARGYLAPGTALTVGLVHGVPEVAVATFVVIAIGMGLARAGFVQGRRDHTARKTS